jgi:hypothetical protein
MPEYRRRKNSDTSAATPRWTAKVQDGISNLHDAFLSSHLMYLLLERVPDETAARPLQSLTDDRYRYERLWVAFLYVLVEAWKANKMYTVKQWIQQVTDTTELDRLLDVGCKSGRLARMKECRNYMFHRGFREYSDDGFFVPALDSDFHKEVYLAFVTALREAIDALNAAKREERCLRTQGQPHTLHPHPRNSADRR